MPVLLSESANSDAAPERPVVTVSGRPIRRSARRNASKAAPREEPGATLNDRVTAGNRPWWVTESGATRRSTRTKAESGTAAPASR